MAYIIDAPVSFDLRALYQSITADLADLEQLALELKTEQAPSVRTPDLAELRDQVQELADQLAVTDTGHLVNSVSNIEAYLSDDPGAALHHIRELRRRLLFRRWPIGRRLYEIIQDLSETELLLETQPDEHIEAVLEDLQRSRHFHKFVPPDHQPGIAAFCIEEGILYSDDVKAALRGYLMARQTAATIGDSI